MHHPWVSGRTVAANNLLQSPGQIGARRKELRSPVKAVQGGGKGGRLEGSFFSLLLILLFFFNLFNANKLLFTVAALKKEEKEAKLTTSKCNDDVGAGGLVRKNSL